MDRALPFGLRSALKLFTAVADVIAWGFHMAGIQDQIHYLDDFLFSDPLATVVAARALSVALRILDVFQWISIRLRGRHIALQFWA